MFRKGRWYQCVHLHSPSLHHWWERRHLFLPYLPFSPPAAGPQHLTSRFTNLSLPTAPIWSSNLAFLPSLPHQKPPFCIQNKGLKLGSQDLSGQVTFPASSFPSTQCEHTSPVTLLCSLSSAFAKASTTFQIISESHSPSLQALWPYSQQCQRPPLRLLSTASTDIWDRRSNLHLALPRNDLSLPLH